GYDKRQEPNPDCPECFGEGIGEVFMHDTRNLSPAAKVLYRGVKIGKGTIEMSMASAEKAQEILAKVLKLTEDKTELNVVINTDLEDRYQKAMAKSRAMQQEVQERNQQD